MQSNRIDGTTLLRLFETAAERLERAVDEVNALNVYPVPDGDTGTNMLHTVRSALTYARRAEQDLASIAGGLAHGALMGARGNSGVILSQVIRGVKEAVADAAALGPAELRNALALARRYANDAVTTPAPGTMLTVTAAIEEAAGGVTGDVTKMLVRIVAAADAAVARTRQENPTNRAAGVVDAGAKGLYYLLEGALAAAQGRAIPTTRTTVAPAPSPTTVAAEVSSWKGAYDVQFLVEHPSRPIGDVRGEMEGFGADCVLVVGDESVMKVHVHTLHPDEIIRIGLSAGRIADVVVEDLDAMTAEHERATGIIVTPQAPVGGVGVLAIVPGEGFAAVARSLGATAITGGATMNPSTEEILTAIRGVRARHVIVLPNDGNVILAAESARGLAEVAVTVIPTRNVGQGMAALVAFDPAADPVEVVGEMREVAERAHGIEVTRALRDSVVDGTAVRRGEAIALLDGRLVTHGDDEVAVLVDAARRLTDAEIFTLYSGAGVDDARVEYAAQRLRAGCPRAEVEVKVGGQSHYPFIVTVE